MTNNTALNIQQLSFAYGKKPVLKNVDLVVKAGQCCILLGPNGAGKSTLFSLITRLYSYSEGQIALAGFDLKQQPLKALAQLGVVFQQPTLDLDLTVQQNLFYHASLQGISRKLAKSAIQQQLECLAMFERKDELVRQLNGGHRRRVEIARALLHQPQLLLLDEPTVGLDVPSRQAMVEQVHALVKQSNTAVLWATHLMDEIYPEDEVVVIHQGNIKATGNVEQVIKSVDAKTIQDAFFKLTQGKK